MAVLANLGGIVPLVDDILSSRQQQIYSTASLDKNCIKFEFQLDWNFYVDLRQTYLALKMNFFSDRGYKTYNTGEVRKEDKEEAKADDEMEAEEKQEAPVPLVTHVKIILHSIFSNVVVYINNQQIYQFNELYGHKSYISNFPTA